MPSYRVNKNSDSKGLHEVHADGCLYYRALTNFYELGYHSNEIDAVNYAKRTYYSTADGCKYCCPRAHKG